MASAICGGSDADEMCDSMNDETTVASSYRAFGALDQVLDVDEGVGDEDQQTEPQNLCFFLTRRETTATTQRHNDGAPK